MSNRALIVGGTGTLGQELTRQLLDRGYSVTVFSRDELKQKQMADKFQDGRISYLIGDVRDLGALRAAMRDVYVVFHAAALKHVDSLEFNPEESVKTNVLGTMNVADAAVAEHVRYVVFSSTDKAVAPVNAYGMSKALSEKILLNRNRVQTRTLFSVFRWGNIIASRGSVIPIFARKLQTEKKAYLTHPDMTRFFIRIDEAVAFMIDKFRSADGVMIPPMKATKIHRVIEGVMRALQITDAEIHVCGIRPGEKIHESISDSVHSDSAPQMTPAEIDTMVTHALEVAT